jgi:prepilin-type N-terminal cleavage/methylation domain-containing protein
MRIKYKNYFSFLKGFTLIELMVAITILALMMSFIFTLLGRTVAAWETANKRIEASMAARVGLSILSEQLETALVGVKEMEALPSGNVQSNVFPMAVLRSPKTIPGVSRPEIFASPGSDQIFFITTTGRSYGNPAALPYAETGFFCEFVANPGYHNRTLGYYLMKHHEGVEDYYFRGTSTVTTNWFGNLGVSQTVRFPIIENCLRLKITPVQTNNAGNFSSLSGWNSFNVLPDSVVGFHISILLIDSRTAKKIFQIKGNQPLSSSEIDSITNASPPSNELQRLLREGSIQMQRYVPLINKI